MPEPRAPARREDLHGGGHKPEGVGQQGVARKDGGGFIEGLVAGGLPPAHAVVVHAGEIVVDEGIGVDHLQRAGVGKSRLRAAAAETAEFQQQHRADPLAAVQQAVPGQLVGKGIQAPVPILPCRSPTAWRVALRTVALS